MTSSTPHGNPPTVAGINAPRDELARLIRSRFPIIFVDTQEEARAEGLLRAAARACGRSMWTWSVSEGLVAAESSDFDVSRTDSLEDTLGAIAARTGDEVYVLRDAAAHITPGSISERRLRDLTRSLGSATIVLVGPHPTVPANLKTSAAVFVLERPDRELIDAHVRTTVVRIAHAHDIKLNLDIPEHDALVNALRGLTLEQVDQVLLHVLHDDGRLDASDIARAIEAKGKILARDGVLALEHPTQGLDWVAGFPALKAWVGARSNAFGPDAVQFGLTPPRGLLLTGVPGCGKSFVAKAIAYEWGMPLLRLDAGAIYDSFVGASERNLRDSLTTAGAIAPSILWIDEIEKGFGSTGPSATDGGLAYRLLGTLATWMQERPHPVFLIATSNDITKLPPELTRQGRFDETFFIDLPDSPAREHLYRLQLARRGREHSGFDCAHLASISTGFSGAEIEQSVTNALYTAFAASQDLSSQHIAIEIERTRPLSEVSPEVIDRIRAWGSEHARQA